MTLKKIEFNSLLGIFKNFGWIVVVGVPAFSYQIPNPYVRFGVILLMYLVTRNIKYAIIEDSELKVIYIIRIFNRFKVYPLNELKSVEYFGGLGAAYPCITFNLSSNNSVIKHKVDSPGEEQLEKLIGILKENKIPYKTR